jgi:hypothetical protein
MLLSAPAGRQKGDGSGRRPAGGAGWRPGADQPLSLAAMVARSGPGSGRPPVSFSGACGRRRERAIGGGPVGRSAGLSSPGLAGEGIGQFDHDHAVVQKGVDEAHEGGFLGRRAGGGVSRTRRRACPPGPLWPTGRRWRPGTGAHLAAHVAEGWGLPKRMASAWASSSTAQPGPRSGLSGPRRPHLPMTSGRQGFRERGAGRPRRGDPDPRPRRPAWARALTCP